MHKALFGMITVAAFVAVGALIYNRSLESKSQRAATEKTPVAAVANCGCCAASADVAKSKLASCCDTVATTSAKSGTCCAGSKGECCSEATVAVSTKAGSCCADSKGECCAGAEGSCCAGDAETEVSTASAVTVAVAKPCGCLNECTCEKKAEAEGNQK